MIPGKDSRCFFSAECPFRLEGPPSLLFSAYWGLFSHRQCTQGVRLTIRFHLAPRLRTGWAEYPLSYMPSLYEQGQLYLYLYDPILISQAVPLLQTCPQKSCAYFLFCLCEPLVHPIYWAHWFCARARACACVCVCVYKCLWAEILLLFCHHVASHSYSWWYMCHVTGITKNTLLCRMYY